jgi:hypothetical protein
VASATWLIAAPVPFGWPRFAWVGGLLLLAAAAVPAWLRPLRGGG